VTDIASDRARILDLARAQLPDPTGWSLVVDPRWLERLYFGPGASRLTQALPTGELGGSAAVSVSGSDDAAEVTVASMLRPGFEDLWTAQHAWIELQVADRGATTAVRVVSECLTEAEKRRWAAAGFDLVFEELAMERDLPAEKDSPGVRWPTGSTVLEWGVAAAGASFEVYDAAFRDRPGFPGWSPSEWVDRLTSDADFVPEASLCVLLNGAPAGFVVCSRGWIDQVGVVPVHRRLGLASALVTEASRRLRATGIRVVHLHVNANNPEARATWQRLGWRESGRRGRFERTCTRSVPGPAGTQRVATGLDAPTSG
jgi:mycothiol synthase